MVSPKVQVNVYIHTCVNKYIFYVHVSNYISSLFYFLMLFQVSGMAGSII